MGSFCKPESVIREFIEKMESVSLLDYTSVVLEAFSDRCKTEFIKRERIRAHDSDSPLAELRMYLCEWCEQNPDIGYVKISIKQEREQTQVWDLEGREQIIRALAYSQYYLMGKEILLVVSDKNDVSRIENTVIDKVAVIHSEQVQDMEVFINCGKTSKIYLLSKSASKYHTLTNMVEGIVGEGIPEEVLLHAGLGKETKFWVK